MVGKCVTKAEGRILGKKYKKMRAKMGRYAFGVRYEPGSQEHMPAESCPKETTNEIHGAKKREEKKPRRPTQPSQSRRYLLVEV